MVQKIHSFKPFPEYQSGEEQKFVDAMKPIHKALTKLLDELEGKIKTCEDTCRELGIETTAILPDIMSIKDLTKQVLTLCCSHTATRILTSKAAANAAGHLLQSIDAVFDFVLANGLLLSPSLVDRLKACRSRLVTASATKQQAAQK